MKKKISKEFVIGLSVIVAILILFFGIDYLKGINLFRPANFYEVYYDNVAGLTVSAPVTINGYKVGQVRDISIDYKKPGKVKVTLACDKDLRIPSDSQAALASSLLSGASVELLMGASSQDLPVGSTIQPYETTDLMASLQNDLMPKVNGILPKVDSLLYNLNVLVSDPALAASIQRLDGITANIYTASEGLNTSLNKQLPGILRNANVATVHIDTIADNLAVLSRHLKTLPLNSTMENIDQLTANLNEFSLQLKNPNSTLGKLTNDPALYNQLNKVSADIDSLIIDIKKNPKRYISIKLL